MPGPAAEIDITPALVRALLQEQHPDLAPQHRHSPRAGWDNVTYRLGDELCVRMPRRAASAPLILHEQRWLPELAPGWTLPVPVPVRVGVPGVGYPWAWSVCPWLPGVEIEESPPGDWSVVARQLGEFLGSVHRPAPPDAPFNPYRGIPLGDRADALTDGLARLDLSQTERVGLAERWRLALAAPPWAGPPLWLHGDVHPLNLLIDEGRLSAAIDFGDITAGDPASDLAVAWMLFTPAARIELRAAYDAPAATDGARWARAKGWAIALGVAFADGDDRVAAIGRRTLAAVLADKA